MITFSFFDDEGRVSKCSVLIIADKSGASVAFQPADASFDCQKFANALVRENILLKNCPKDLIDWYLLDADGNATKVDLVWAEDAGSYTLLDAVKHPALGESMYAESTT